MPYRFLVIAAAALVFSACATAQSLGDARTPAQMAFRAFPEADVVRRIARDVKHEDRAKIEKRLPFKVHFDEIGRHELFVAFRGRRPVGVLYMRSEETEWGLADIGWAIGLDGHVVTFEFANSRSSKAESIANSRFARRLFGLDEEGLVAMFRASPTPTVETDPNLAPLARTVLRSALKATTVLDVVWHDEIRELADTAVLLEEFPGAIRHTRRIVAPEPSADGRRRFIELRYMEALGRGEFSLGSVARTTILLGNRTLELCWVLDPNDSVLAIKPVHVWPDPSLNLAFATLRGRRPEDSKLPDTVLTPAARALGRELLRLRRRGGER